MDVYLTFHYMKLMWLLILSLILCIPTVSLLIFALIIVHVNSLVESFLSVLITFMCVLLSTLQLMRMCFQCDGGIDITILLTFNITVLVCVKGYLIVLFFWFLEILSRNILNTRFVFPSQP